MENKVAREPISTQQIKELGMATHNGIVEQRKNLNKEGSKDLITQLLQAADSVNRKSAMDSLGAKVVLSEEWRSLAEDALKSSSTGYVERLTQILYSTDAGSTLSPAEKSAAIAIDAAYGFDGSRNPALLQQNKYTIDTDSDALVPPEDASLNPEMWGPNLGALSTADAVLAAGARLRMTEDDIVALFDSVDEDKIRQMIQSGNKVGPEDPKDFLIWLAFTDSNKNYRLGVISRTVLKPEQAQRRIAENVAYATYDDVIATKISENGMDEAVKEVRKDLHQVVEGLRQRARMEREKMRAFSAVILSDGVRQ